MGFRTPVAALKGVRSDMHQVFAETREVNYLVFITGASRTADI